MYIVNMKLASALLVVAAVSVSSAAAFAPAVPSAAAGVAATSSSSLRASYLDSLDPMGSPPGGDDGGMGPSEHWSTARNGGGYQYANPYSSAPPGYEATAYGRCDSDYHGYSSELRALEGNYYDSRGPNLGYDDDLKYVGGRGVAYRPVRGSATGRTSGWADGRGPPPGMDYYPGEHDRTPGNYRDASTSAHNSWWDNPGQTYQVARGAQGSFRTYTDVQRDRHGPRRNF